MINIYNKILLYLTFLLFSLFNYSNITTADYNFDNNLNKNNDKITIIAKIKDDMNVEYNYIHLFVIDTTNNNIICQGMTKQSFEPIILDTGKPTDVLKVSENGTANILCDKTKLINSDGKINKNIKISLKSDGFYDIYGQSIDLVLNNDIINNNEITIGNYQDGNYKVLLSSINGSLINKYSQDFIKQSNNLNEELAKSEKLKSDEKKVRNIKLTINNIPQDINNIKYVYNNTNYIYDKNKDNFLVSSADILDRLIFGEGNKIIENIKIDNNKANIQFEPDFIKNNIFFTLSIDNIPNIRPEIDIFIDNIKYLYAKDKQYLLNDQQINNGFNLTVGIKTFNKIKLKKSEALKIDYSTIVSKVETIKKDETLNNDYLAIKLQKSTLDPLGRLTYFEILDNGGNSKKVIDKDNILIDGDNIIIKEFLYKNDLLISSILINGKEYNLEKISLNYKGYIVNRLN